MTEKKQIIALRDLARYSRERNFAYNNGLYFDINKELENKYKCRRDKCKRIKEKIITLVLHQRRYIYFCTFTFDNHYISKSDRTRKDLIKKTLYDFDIDILYILNVDFGKKNERLHYHGIIGTDNPGDLRSFLKYSYPCMTSCDPIYLGSKGDFTELSKYINKLSNHATKDTTRRFRLLSNFDNYYKRDNLCQVENIKIKFRLEEDISILNKARS